MASSAKTTRRLPVLEKAPAGGSRSSQGLASSTAEGSLGGGAFEAAASDAAESDGGGTTSDQTTSSAKYTPAPGAHERARRFWSTRRVPAALLALVVLGATGLLLYDVSAVRADRPAMRWRRRLSDELATRSLDDVWIVTGASIAMALGLWLIILALTPGRRGVLPMRPDTRVRAGLDRSAVALVLRDRAMEVPGVRAVRVHAGRRRVKVRALAHFRELDEVRTDLDAALDDGIRQLGLARRPGLRVQVRRPTKR
ncbi:DUF6286 domain-containing protein [Streptomyces zagrosensis]|uniref:DUF6286 domain-containing protein n=1 Tax=Streptomyces zagrosensis TaxID=1042984 RepID=UPI0035E4620B